jgi:hypothetical protein
MKEREDVVVSLQDGEFETYRDAEVTRADKVLVVHTADAIHRFNWDFVASYSVYPVGVKNLDD